MYGVSVVSTSVAVLAFRAMRKRDKDAAMTQQNKDIREIMVDMGAVKAQLTFTSTKEDIASIRERLLHMPTSSEMQESLRAAKAEIIEVVKNERGL
jgi:hypothetical protein